MERPCSTLSLSLNSSQTARKTTNRGGKFERYREISSFREYLVVAQDRVYVEHHVREDAGQNRSWIMR